MTGWCEIFSFLLLSGSLQLTHMCYFQAVFPSGRTGMRVLCRVVKLNAFLSSICRLPFPLESIYLLCLAKRLICLSVDFGELEAYPMLQCKTDRIE